MRNKKLRSMTKWKKRDNEAAAGNIVWEEGESNPKQAFHSFSFPSPISHPRQQKKVKRRRFPFYWGWLQKKCSPQFARFLTDRCSSRDCVKGGEWILAGAISTFYPLKRLHKSERIDHIALKMSRRKKEKARIEIRTETGQKVGRGRRRKRLG